MVIRERVVVDSVVHFAIGISGTLCAKLPYRPVLAMLTVEELYEGV
jgi:hypothetical protein